MTQELRTRHDLQLTRRIFHFFNGFFISVLYFYYFSHTQMIHFLGTISCLIYIVEQVRINYPEISGKLLPITKFIMRAEEQIKESAMVPYLIAVLLTIITFPKFIAITAILTLAIADPLSAIIGIRFGKKKIAKSKTLEGSIAFFTSTLLIHILVLSQENTLSLNLAVAIALSSLLISIVELLPLKIDDNMTIPLGTSFILWPISLFFNLLV